VESSLLGGQSNLEVLRGEETTSTVQGIYSVRLSLPFWCGRFNVQMPIVESREAHPNVVRVFLDVDKVELRCNYNHGRPI